MKKIFFPIAFIFMATVLLNAEEVTEEAKEEAKKEVIEQVKKEVIKEDVDVKKETKSAKAYIADLSSEDENTVVQAIDWLGNEKEAASVPELMKLLKSDKRVKVRLFAAIALGLIGDEKSIVTLNEALLNDRSADVRYTVLLAIHRIDPSKSIDALQKAKESESDPYIVDYLTKMEAKIKGE